MRSARLVCLLPARNCASDLPGYFASASHFADAVVALDDGSTDGTRAALAREPAVVRLLENPVRTTYAGWDDAANRNRLLHAAGELEPDWILFLDADERIAQDEASALRSFIAGPARPGYGYLLEVYRMLGASEFEQPPLVVGRLFAHEPGQTLPTTRLHLVALPMRIPRRRWVRTTLRIQHFGSSTPERRAARYAKYLQADPHRRFQNSYEHLLSVGERPLPWRPRPAGLAVVPPPLGRRLSPWRVPAA